MALFRRKADPISDRARALNSEIAALEAQIRKYETNLQRMSADAVPGESSGRHPHPAAGPPSVQEVELEDSSPARLASPEELDSDLVHVNDLGIQKYDLPGLISKVRGVFRSPTTSNPKLVSYLAAGGIQGLRPLRYEKRVARNRFLVFALILLVLLIGLLFVFVPR